jgi:nucleoside-diphosphate-sugar epimerase
LVFGNHDATRRGQPSFVTLPSSPRANGLVLVTGGTGLVGQSLVEALLRGGARVRVLSRARKADIASQAAVEMVTGDISDTKTLRQAMTDVEAVIHAAAAVSGPAASLWRTNVTGSRLVAHEAKRARVTRFVHLSSAGVYGSGDGRHFLETDTPHPEDAYACSKLEAEIGIRSELRDSDVKWAILRPCGIYGARRIEFFLEVRRRRVWFYGPSTVVVHPTHVDDVIAASLAALERVSLANVNGETFNVAGERALPHFDYVQQIARRLGVSVHRVSSPAWLTRKLRPVASFAAPQLSPRLAERVTSRAADLEKTRSILGFEPLALETAIDKTVRQAQASLLA